MYVHKTDSEIIFFCLSGLLRHDGTRNNLEINIIIIKKVDNDLLIHKRIRTGMKVIYKK